MRFIGITGVIAKAKRFVSTAESIFESDVQDDNKLVSLLRNVLLRVAEVESKIPPEGMEFEVAVGDMEALVSFNHNLNCQVRWWVTCWTRPVSQGAYPTAAPVLVQDASSTANTLVLRSSVIGRAVVRIEPSFGVMES